MDLQGRTLVIRVDEATLGASNATFFSDLVFLGNMGMRPIVVAPTKDAARAVVRTMNRSGDTAVGRIPMLPRKTKSLKKVAFEAPSVASSTRITSVRPCRSIASSSARQRVRRADGSGAAADGEAP